MKSEKAIDIAVQLANTLLATSTSDFPDKSNAEKVANFIETLSARLMTLDYKGA